MRRVRARPVMDSDPVRRQGPERDNRGGGGRPRSFPSGPPPPAAGRRADPAARAKPARPPMSSPQAATTRPAFFIVEGVARTASLDSSYGQGKGGDQRVRTNWTEFLS